MSTRFLICREAASSEWEVQLGMIVAGNYTLEQLLDEIRKDIATERDKPWGFYRLNAPGVRYTGEDCTPVEQCDTWALVDFEVYRPESNNSSHDAMVLLRYNPVNPVSVVEQELAIA